jgi:hypothetical protein
MTAAELLDASKSGKRRINITVRGRGENRWLPR